MGVGGGGGGCKERTRRKPLGYWPVFNTLVGMRVSREGVWSVWFLLVDDDDVCYCCC